MSTYNHTGLLLGTPIVQGVIASQCSTETSVITQQRTHFAHNKYLRTNERKYFFTQHIITFWNSLPQDVVKAKSINGVKEETRQIHGESVHQWLLKYDGPDGASSSGNP